MERGKEEGWFGQVVYVGLKEIEAQTTCPTTGRQTAEGRVVTGQRGANEEQGPKGSERIESGNLGREAGKPSKNRQARQAGAQTVVRRNVSRRSEQGQLASNRSDCDDWRESKRPRVYNQTSDRARRLMRYEVQGAATQE